MSNIFQDGEPVDAKKLNDMQIEINDLESTANEAYSLSKSTASDLNVLNITHIKATRVEFATGFKAKQAESVDIPLDWTGYLDVFITATPRYPAVKYDLQWSISGSIGGYKLNVLSGVNITVPIKFDIVAAGTKPKGTA
jgi:hypothetical protein